MSDDDDCYICQGFTDHCERTLAGDLLHHRTDAEDRGDTVHESDPIEAVIADEVQRLMAELVDLGHQIRDIANDVEARHRAMGELQKQHTERIGRLDILTECLHKLTCDQDCACGRAPEEH